MIIGVLIRKRIRKVKVIEGYDRSRNERGGD